VDGIRTTLRLERVGETFTASYTQGGKEWTALPPIKAKKLFLKPSSP